MGAVKGILSEVILPEEWVDTVISCVSAPFLAWQFLTYVSFLSGFTIFLFRRYRSSHPHDPHATD